MRVLVDMDGVLADFEAGFLREWRKRYPQLEFIPQEERSTFYIVDEYKKKFSEAWEEDIRVIYSTPGFFRELVPIPGGVYALQDMVGRGWEVFICSSPFSDYIHCLAEKYEWVEQHLGKEWTRKIILTKDKTIIQGDVLIDDKAKIQGVQNPPCWKHLLFDAPYNRCDTHHRKIRWENWKEVLLEDAG